MKKIGIFIPGRLASERCPNKLILPIADTCLWDIACEKLNRISNKYKKYALVYDQPLIDIASKYDNINVIEREKTTAFADSPSVYVFKDVAQMDVDYLMFMNPCFAFIKAETIEDILDDFANSPAESATSVTLFNNYLFDTEFNPMSPIDYKNINTKEVEPSYVMAHVFHIFNKENFLNTGNMLEPGHACYKLEHGDELLDVDTIEEFEFVRHKYEIRN